MLDETKFGGADTLMLRCNLQYLAHTRCYVSLQQVKYKFVFNCLLSLPFLPTALYTQSQFFGCDPIISTGHPS